MTHTVNVDTVAGQLADSYKQWVFGAEKRRPLMPQHAFKEGSDRNYNLKGTEPRKFLQWEEQDFGINLGWTDDASPSTGVRVSRWFAARPGGATAQVKYGEPIALGYGKSPSFIRYENRTFGINLGWSKTPVFEWRLLGGVTGRPVECGDRLAIHNAKAGSADVPGVLIHFDRTVGGDIGWPDSQSWWDQVKDKLPGIAKDALTALIMAKLRGG
ncbi:hypothetical protein [Amycolatopsis pittospori]|uniref:hypothetical protein n=1 Tax=Amycolatopsis pittospori TaxID=2749434 RepID=UPI0015F11EB9|nr:hypothetical protein [Amycolatopsis pittospori]